jgi:hypothetical protein
MAGDAIALFDDHEALHVIHVSDSPSRVELERTRK